MTKLLPLQYRPTVPYYRKFVYKQPYYDLMKENQKRIFILEHFRQLISEKIKQKEYDDEDEEQYYINELKEINLEIDRVQDLDKIVSSYLHNKERPK